MTGRALDLSGKEFSKLTALYVMKVDGIRCWKCKCVCGNEVIVPTSQLLNGNKKSCRCDNSKVKVGQRYGNLVVQEVLYNQKSKPDERLSAKCLCDCGNTKITHTRYLTRGSSTSCGCKTFEKQSRIRRGKYGESLKNRVFDSYVRNAKIKGQKFSLSKDRVFELFTGNCYYCGDAPSRTISRKKFYGAFTYNGIDRLDSTIGYIEGNVVSCCKTCNFMKSSMHHDVFLEIIRKIAKQHP